jgi:hypothetical protein
MKMFRLFWTFVLAVGLAGCAGDGDKDYRAPLTHLTPVEPPSFINADVAGLFGTANFSARVEMQRGFPGARPAMIGELSGRDGSLFFIADEQRSNRGFSGGLSALWDAPTQTAYFLNEPLQGYAPMRPATTNGPVEITPTGEEDIGTEHCRKSVINRRVGAELIPILVVWRGIAEQDFPLRIQTTNTPGAVTLTLSRIRRQAPPADLFQLPNGFKKYDTTDAMLSELMRRKTDAREARSKMRRERYGVRTGDEEEPTLPDKPMRNY